MTRLLKHVAAVAAVATLATIQIAAAPQGRGGAAGGPGGPGPGPLPILRGLNLTDSQREQIRSIVKAEREQNGPRAGADLHRQLQLALFSETPDLGKDRGAEGRNRNRERGSAGAANRARNAHRAGPDAGAADAAARQSLEGRRSRSTAGPPWPRRPDQLDRRQLVIELPLLRPRRALQELEHPAAVGNSLRRQNRLG